MRAHTRNVKGSNPQRPGYYIQSTSAYELPGCVSQDIVHELRERFPFRPSGLRSAVSGSNKPVRDMNTWRQEQARDY